MVGSSEKEPIASAGPEDLQQFLPPAYSAVAVKPAATGRFLKAGVAVLIAGALLLLLGAVGAFYFWNNSEKHVYNVHYSMSINGKVEEGAMEIDPAHGVERFSTGSGGDRALEVHDFQIGITGIRFSGGEKCYIKSQVKARLPDVETLNKEAVTFDLEDEVMPARFEDDLIWVAADSPLTDSAFLSAKIKDLCEDLPIFWLRPTYSTSAQRKRRAAAPPRRRRQATGMEGGAEEDVEAEFNPENPYQRGLEGEQDGVGVGVDPMLDHQGVCCHECRRGHTHCQRVCEPLGGFHPWPYHYRGCRVACRVIMPCNWWVARIMGLV
ncbi:leukocyte cell-derived chemotaxin 1-like [Antennarius striatus]|uniref:leukocyte cell-derived chemotaxin 1-like n=1 Tax=Antennarius striatus TaxID=241820 RepID=UPI0035B2AC5B